MSQDDDKARGKRARIARLRARVQRSLSSSWHEPKPSEMLGVILGILDLLEDEL